MGFQVHTLKVFTKVPDQAWLIRTSDEDEYVYLRPAT